MYAITRFDRTHNLVKPALYAVCKYDHRYRESQKTDRNQDQLSHSSPRPFALGGFTLSLFLFAFPCESESMSPSTPSPPIPESLLRSSIFTGPRISTTVSSFASASRTNSPCG